MDELIEAIINDDIATVRDLLTQQKVSPNTYLDRGKLTPLHFVAQRVQPNAVPIAQLLINAGAYVHATCLDGQTPLDIAKLHDHKEMIELLQNSVTYSVNNI